MTSASPRAEPRLAYEPGLDGLRGVWVLGICLYHADVSWAAGGFLGVTGFFVLSGYLITRLLLVEGERSGRIDLPRFWARRARRILPAVTLFLAVLVGVAFAVPDAVDGPRLRGDVLSTLAFANNWWQIAEGHSYFDAFLRTSWLRHLWSISIEEQWFLVFPLLWAGLARWGVGTGGRAGVLGGLTLGSAALGLALAASGAGTSRLYYGTDVRALELLVGTLLALATHGRPAPRGTLSVAVGAIALAGSVTLWSVVDGRTPWLHPGGFALAALLAAGGVHGATATGPNPLRGLLAFAPLRGLGIVSYGFYLWHWPVFVVLGREATGLEGMPLLAVRMLVSGAAAVASYVLVERPVRRGGLGGARGSALALAASAGVAGAALFLAPLGGPPGATHGAAQTEAREAAPDSGPESGPASDRTAPAGARPVLFVGDSIAWSLANGFVPSIEAAHHLAVANRAVPGCGLAHGAERVGRRVAVRDEGTGCERWPDEWRRMVAAAQPRVSVLLAGSWELFDVRVDGRWLAFGSPGADAFLRERLERATAVLTAGGARLALLTLPDLAPRSTGIYAPVRGDGERVAHWNALLAAHARRHGDRVVLVDLAAHLCADGDCETTPEGRRARSDGMHFDTDGARRVARWLAPRLARLAAAGDLPPLRR